MTRENELRGCVGEGPRYLGPNSRHKPTLPHSELSPVVPSSCLKGVRLAPLSKKAIEKVVFTVVKLKLGFRQVTLILALTNIFLFFSPMRAFFFLIVFLQIIIEVKLLPYLVN